jgi:hypothetical protein
MPTALAVATALLAAFAPGAAAQGAGRIAGRVLDQTGAVLPGVIVDLAIAGRELTTATDASGDYAIDNVPTGTGELAYRLVNFTIARRTVTVAAGTTDRRDVVLTVALNADVIVTAPATFRNIADVSDPAGNLVGIAAAASQGAITAEQLEVRPTMRPGEIPRNRARPGERHSVQEGSLLRRRRRLLGGRRRACELRQRAAAAHALGGRRQQRLGAGPVGRVGSTGRRRLARRG